jgi:hypothetical protein
VGLFRMLAREAGRGFAGVAGAAGRLRLQQDTLIKRRQTRTLARRSLGR